MVDWTYDEAISRMLKHEGGFTLHRGDPGNWTGGKVGVGQLKGTKYGIAANSYPNLDIRNLTLDDAKAIYKRDYASKVAYDEQPAGVDYSAFDICVNSGPGRALAILGQALETTSRASTTLARAAQMEPDKVALIKNIAARRGAFYRSLRTFATFGKGWMRRNAEVEAFAVTMALKGANVPGDKIKKRLEKESANARNTSRKQGRAAAGGAVAEGAATTQADSAWSAIDWALAIGGGLMVALLLAWLGYHAWRNRHRYLAYAKASAELISSRF